MRRSHLEPTLAAAAGSDPHRLPVMIPQAIGEIYKALIILGEFFVNSGELANVPECPFEIVSGGVPVWRVHDRASRICDRISTKRLAISWRLLFEKRNA